MLISGAPISSQVVSGAPTSSPIPFYTRDFPIPLRLVPRSIDLYSYYPSQPFLLFEIGLVPTVDLQAEPALMRPARYPDALRSSDPNVVAQTLINMPIPPISALVPDQPVPKGASYPPQLRTLSFYYVPDATVHNPISTFDYPVPLRATYPASLRFSVSTQYDVLYGQDQVFGGPGQPAPSYDWATNPRGQSYPSHLRTLQHEMRLVDVAPQVQTYDWSMNPYGRQYPANLRSAFLQNFQPPASYIPQIPFPVPYPVQYPSQLRTTTNQTSLMLQDTFFNGPGRGVNPFDTYQPRPYAYPSGLRVSTQLALTILPSVFQAFWGSEANAVVGPGSVM